MAPIVLCDYQQQLLADLRAALKVHRRVYAVMPIGAGKGQTIGAILQGAAGEVRQMLVLAHRAELIEQLTRRDAIVYARGLSRFYDGIERFNLTCRLIGRNDTWRRD